MISCIAAIGPNHELGFENKLVYQDKEDLQRFRTLSNRKDVYMGYNTWKSLPVKALPNRMNVVVLDMERGISRELNKAMMENKNLKAIDEAMFLALLEIYHLASKEIMIIGGARLYKQTQYYWDKVYLTRFFEPAEDVDTFFPKLDYSKYGLIVYEKRKNLEFLDLVKIME